MSATASRPIVRFRLWARRAKLSRKLAFALVLAALASCIATVVAWTGASSVAPDRDTILVLLYVDGVLLLLLGAVIARQVVKLWSEQLRGRAGAGLHSRLVLMFSLVAVTPAILVAVFSALFLNFGVQVWFSERVRTAVEASNAVASAYLHEHRQSIRADAFAMANDLNREAPALMRDRGLFGHRLTVQAQLRALSEALVVDGSGRVLARSPLSLALEFDLAPRDAIEQARQGQIAVLTTENENRVRAVVKLNRFVDAYLLIGRFVEASVLEHIERTAGAVAQYQRLEERRGGIFITFVVIFVVVALLLLLAAVWIGMNLATQITEPISDLISAAEQVREGDLSVRVEAGGASMGEIGTLSRAFNRMTSQIQGQQQGLIDANRELDERRRFTETVLSGVSAGVIGLDSSGRINLPNRSASELLDTDLEAAAGRPLASTVPEMADLVDEALGRPDRQVQAEIKLLRGGSPRTLIARIASERLSGEVIGYVVTFDDVTALVSAQRKAAWADVARRIAHEIKNPLTPIQLSAERLRRKYTREIETDRETFESCTETIIRQVEDIGRMVDEFSSFARMPRPDLKPEGLPELVRQAVFLERSRSPGIEFDVRIPDGDLRLVCDGRQISRALTNILKNAAESVLTRLEDQNGEGAPGHVQIAVTTDSTEDGGRRVDVVVEDNGLGLPAEDRDRLTEPYVTNRAKGTGLGLAIVKKIMEDHNGDLILDDADGGGARVSLVFRIAPPSDREPDSDASEDEPVSRVDDAMTVATGLRANG